MADQTYLKTYAEFTGLTTDAPNGGALVVAINASDIEQGLRHVIVKETEVDITFKGTLSVEHEAILTSIVESHTGQGLSDPVDDDGRLIVLTQPAASGPNGEAIVYTELPIGGGYRPTSHNFCDPCTWYSHSEELVDTATSTADQITYQVLDGDSNPVEYIIDIRHRRLVDEDAMGDGFELSNGVVLNNILPKVYEDGVQIDPTLEVEKEADLATATDPDSFWIDYPNGRVVFKTARTGTLTVSCRRRGIQPGNSGYRFQPKIGREYYFEDAEVDYTGNFSMESAMNVNVYVSHNQLTDADFLRSQGFPLPAEATGPQIVPGGLLDPTEVRKYKTFHDFQAKARKFMGPLPGGHGGPSRGSMSEKWTFQWDYAFRDVLVAEDRMGVVATKDDPYEMTLHAIELVLDGDVPWTSMDEHDAVFTMTLIGRIISPPMT